MAGRGLDPRGQPGGVRHGQRVQQVRLVPEQPGDAVATDLRAMFVAGQDGWGIKVSGTVTDQNDP